MVWKFKFPFFAPIQGANKHSATKVLGAVIDCVNQVTCLRKFNCESVKWPAPSVIDHDPNDCGHTRLTALVERSRPSSFLFIIMMIIKFNSQIKRSSNWRVNHSTRLTTTPLHITISAHRIVYFPLRPE